MNPRALYGEFAPERLIPGELLDLLLIIGADDPVTLVSRGLVCWTETCDDPDAAVCDVIYFTAGIPSAIVDLSVVPQASIGNEIILLRTDAHTCAWVRLLHQ